MVKTFSTRLNVSLHENPLTSDQDNYIGRIQFVGILTNAAIADHIVEEREEYRPETIINILNMADEIKRKALASGYVINDGVAQMYPSVTGNFTDVVAQFENDKHGVVVTMKSSAKLRKVMESCTIIVHGITHGPVISRVIDMFTGLENTVISPNQQLKILGKRLKIVGDDPTIGVWFVYAANTFQRIPVDKQNILENDSDQLTIIVPNLAKGDYYVEVMTQFSDGNNLFKTPRIYYFETALNVLS